MKTSSQNAELQELGSLAENSFSLNGDLTQPSLQSESSGDQSPTSRNRRARECGAEIRKTLAVFLSAASRLVATPTPPTAALQPLAGGIVPSCRVRAAIITVNEKSLLTMSKSKPTAPQAKKIENRQQGETNPETAASAFKRGSIIRNDPGDEDGIVIKRWQLDSCKGDTDAALMLANLISVFDDDLSPITGAELTLDTFYLSCLTFGFEHKRRIPAVLNKLQSRGLISVRQVTDSERLASSQIRCLIGTLENGLAAAKEMIERTGPAFGIRLESHVIESFLEDEYGRGIPPREPLVLCGKNPKGRGDGRRSQPHARWSSVMTARNQGSRENLP